MAIHIKHDETERRARELAALTGETITGAINAALARRLEEERAHRRHPTLEEMQRATDVFRRKVGLDKAKLNVTREDFDALWEIEGLSE